MIFYKLPNIPIYQLKVGIKMFVIDLNYFNNAFNYEDHLNLYLNDEFGSRRKALIINMGIIQDINRLQELITIRWNSGRVVTNPLFFYNGTYVKQTKCKKLGVLEDFYSIDPLPTFNFSFHGD
ncbi:MAG TPA: hypothetical protein VMV86_04285 [Methanosarcinales archaeon]|nr:hypothetical protein [Methanosarcinales archaeon]